MCLLHNIKLSTCLPHDLKPIPATRKPREILERLTDKGNEKGWVLKLSSSFLKTIEQCWTALKSPEKHVSSSSVLLNTSIFLANIKNAK